MALTELQLPAKTVLAEFVSLWGGNSVTPTNNPKDIADKIRRMLV
jgi:hypothetical protein